MYDLNLASTMLSVFVGLIGATFLAATCKETAATSAKRSADRSAARGAEHFPAARAPVAARVGPLLRSFGFRRHDFRRRRVRSEFVRRRIVDFALRSSGVYSRPFALPNGQSDESLSAMRIEGSDRKRTGERSSGRDRWTGERPDGSSGRDRRPIQNAQSRESISGPVRLC